ncbi:MAG: formamidopyrimidine-DNA glycosylase [Glaciecola sp.]
MPGSWRGWVDGMPELPEVESVRRQLEPELVGRTIIEVWVDDHPAQRFHAVPSAAGHRMLDVRRRGKFLLLTLDEDRELLLHLGMTGSFRFDVRDKHARAVFELDDGRALVFRDPRRFGRVSVVDLGDHAVSPTLATLGPEPLGDDFTVQGFAAALARTGSTVKAALLGQKIVAGVGNIYADEALWRARIRPTSRRVGSARAAVLHQALREVIAEAIEREGTTFSDYQMVNGESGRNAAFLQAYGQQGLPCQRCGTEMRKAVVAGRGTTWCPQCQKV